MLKIGPVADSNIARVCARCTWFEHGNKANKISNKDADGYPRDNASAYLYVRFRLGDAPRGGG